MGKISRTIVSSVLCLCFCSCSYVSAEVKPEIIPLPDSIGSIEILGIAEDSLAYIAEDGETYCIYNFETKQTKRAGTVEKWVSSTGTTATCGARIYFTMYVEREIPQTLLCYVDTQSGKLVEEKALDTKRPFVYLKPVDDQYFLMFDVGKEQGNDYYSYVYLYDSYANKERLIYESVTDMTSNIGDLICTASYDSGKIYILNQHTKDTTKFTMDVVDLTGKILDTIDLSWLDSYFKDPDEKGMYRLMLRFDTQGSNFVLTDYMGETIVFNTKQKILYQGEALDAFRLNNENELLLTLSVDPSRKYLLQDNILVKTDIFPKNARWMWSNMSGEISVYHQQTQDKKGSHINVYSYAVSS